MGYKTVLVKGDPVRDERFATAAAITPGNLLIMDSNNKVLRHNVEGGKAEKMFALEDELQGKQIDNDYANSARIFYGIFRSGDEVYATVTGTPAVGAFLSSKGNGTLKTAVTDSAGVTIEDTPIAVAIEAASGGRQLVRIL